MQESNFDVVKDRLTYQLATPRLRPQLVDDYYIHYQKNCCYYIEQWYFGHSCCSFAGYYCRSFDNQCWFQGVAPQQVL